ncbi:hypothetical protein MOBT1_000020 [Malassezia obtusa]|uniref:Uncharacterized protein n=1 Tax=Malassezia obtusa TaxID=76774 RepID=A0AAF0DVV1_9BASI|nr:hypothetical protein MOBT1_000020 [Malassezia obtusa]
MLTWRVAAGPRRGSAGAMDEDPTWADARAPRHTLESDDDEDVGGTPREVPVTLTHPLRAAHGRTLVVLVGDVGAALLAAAAPTPAQRWPVTGALEVAGHAAAWVHVPAGAHEPVLAYVPRAEWLRTDEGAPLALALLDATAPTSVAVVHAYVPSLYLSDAHTDDAPLRFLAHRPDAAPMPPTWSAAPDVAYAPWGVPNTVSGVPAALAAEGVRRGVPVLLLAAPTEERALPAGWTPPRLTIPYELQRVHDDEAHARLAQLVAPLDARYAARLLALLPRAAADGVAGDTLHCVAVRYLLAGKSHAHAGRVGEGGMYI